MRGAQTGGRQPACGDGASESAGGDYGIGETFPGARTNTFSEAQ
jgi:hypothetical protein